VTVAFDTVVSGLGSKAVDTLKLTLGNTWNALSEDERTACTKLLMSLARAHLLEIAGQDVSHFLPTLEAAFLQWKVVGQQIVLDGLKSAATDVFGYAGAFAGSALAAAVKAAA
jgi:hypothetical protein